MHMVYLGRPIRNVQPRSRRAPTLASLRFAPRATPSRATPLPQSSSRGSTLGFGDRRCAPRRRPNRHSLHPVDHPRRPLRQPPAPPPLPSPPPCRPLQRQGPLPQRVPPTARRQRRHGEGSRLVIQLRDLRPCATRPIPLLLPRMQVGGHQEEWARGHRGGWQ